MNIIEDITNINMSEEIEDISKDLESFDWWKNIYEVIKEEDNSDEVIGTT